MQEAGVLYIQLLILSLASVAPEQKHLVLFPLRHFSPIQVIFYILLQAGILHRYCFVIGLDSKDPTRPFCIVATMDRDHVVDIHLGKEEYDQSSSQGTPGVMTPSPSHQSSHKPVYTAKSCFVCRKTLLLSYFNCCAVCLGIVEGGRVQKEEKPSSDFLPITEPISSPSVTRETTESSSSSSSTPDSENNYGVTTRRTPHCDSSYCRYTHSRLLMLFFGLCELVPALGALAMLNMALYRHD
ncbi:hypothetical protein F4819DRAFT_439584 [Hypoxylon fuscum]|nr:hypothetical protein F4819DRAFT_439584 [Hypoxylon fuscum]